MKNSVRKVGTDLREFFVLNQFRKAIDTCRNALQKAEVKEELSYEYTIVRIFSKMMVTSCAIYTLLINGYPDDAMAPCRQLYESLVIIDTLLRGYQENNTSLLERFMDARKIAALKNDYKRLMCIFSRNAEDEAVKEQMRRIEKEIEPYLSKYHKSQMKDFRDYWWSGYNSFSDMADHCAFPKYYVYSLLSDKVHMNASGVFHYLDDSEPGLILGSTSKGKELPLYYTSLFLYCTTGIIHNAFPEMCPENVIKNWKQFCAMASNFLKR